MQFLQVLIPPKQWLYWNLFKYLIAKQVSLIPPKQWLYWNSFAFFRTSSKTDSTETMVVLKRNSVIKADIFKLAFHRNNGCIETGYKGIHRQLCLIPPKQWLYWNCVKYFKSSFKKDIPPKQWLYWNSNKVDCCSYYKGIPPKQWLYWNHFNKIFSQITWHIPPKQWLYWNLKPRIENCFKTYSTETMVVLKPSLSRFRQIYNIFHRNNGCIETSYYKRYCCVQIYSTETMVVLKQSNCYDCR